MRPFFCYKSSSINFSDADMTRILTPSAAEYTIEYNGAGSLHIEHPADSEGKWKAIQCGEIIMAPIMRRGEDFPQPFRIYKVTKTRRNGIPIIIAEALHIFYDLNYATTSPYKDDYYNNYTVSEYLKGRGEEQNGLPRSARWAQTTGHHGSVAKGGHYMASMNWNMGDPQYWKTPYDLFTGDSNIDGTFNFNTQGNSIPITQHLISDQDSVSAITGGILFVDKRRFSLNSPMEGSITNAFTIAYGLNLEGITQTIDTSNVITLLDPLFEVSALSDYVKPGIPYASTGYSFSRLAKVSLNYSSMPDQSIPKADGESYLYERSTPNTEYSIQLTARQISDEVANIATYEIGDTGTIYDPDLDINTTQMITKKVVDLMTQRVKSVELSSTNNRSFRRTWSNTITSGQSALEKRLNAMG